MLVNNVNGIKPELVAVCERVAQLHKGIRMLHIATPMAMDVLAVDIDQDEVTGMRHFAFNSQEVTDSRSNCTNPDVEWL
jgi:hypothetical protein